MAFCTHCGAPLPEHGKFCPNCGASVETDTPAEIPAAAEAADTLTPAAPPVPTQQQLPGAETDAAKTRKKPRRVVGTLCALASLALALVAFFGDPPALSIIFAVAAIVAGVFAFVKKGRLKAFAIIAFLIAAFSLVASIWYIARGDTMVATSKAEVSYDQTKHGSKSGSTSKAAAQTSGVDPDLAAFLSSYESFIDEYVAFMENYLDDPSNVISMLGDYLEMTQKLEDFSERADRFDPDDMSAADTKYYLEVMARCEMKLLNAMG